MPNAFITALKDNKNDIRKKVLISAGITLAAVAAGVLLVKLNDQTENVILVLEDATEAAADAVTE